MITINPRLSITKKKTSISLNIDDINQLKFNNNIKLRNNIINKNLDVKIISINKNVVNVKLYDNNQEKDEYIIEINQQWLLFESHEQATGGDQCFIIATILNIFKIPVWYDMKVKQITTGGNYNKIFLIILYIKLIFIYRND